MQHKSAIVIGAGIVGLAITRSLAERGYAVTVFERNQKAVGASIRNFGMLWPIGQPNGKMYERALVTKSIWKQVCNEANLWYEEKGSLHAAYHELEEKVIQEFVAANKTIRPVAALSAKEAAVKSEGLNTENLKCALWSHDEMIIESRVAMEKLPHYFAQKYGVTYHFNTVITSIEYPTVKSGKRRWKADEIYVCSGADFETLYPEVFQDNAFTKCKLQMMRFVLQNNWRIGPSLCGGLSLIHYKAFEVAPSLAKLKSYYQQNMPDYLKWGIHVMVSQNAEGELTIGDSHEYALVHDPFNKQFINQLILDYLKQFARFKNWQLLQSWNGIYPKITNGKNDFIYNPEEGVTIVNGLGGAGMTLAFGLAEEVLNGQIA
ncbi:MAG TPA: TIGR03364 family FAD-dependent oxidoreductase [Segetibacter sp.]|nr:TIGR03364 family FAD-dependent oxidoreductase [Segetibacter sp.]